MIRLTTKYIRRFFAGLYNSFKENFLQVLQTHGGWQLIILVYDTLDAVIVNLTEPIESLTAGGLVRLLGLGGLYLPLMPWAGTPVRPWLTYDVCRRCFPYYGIHLLGRTFRLIGIDHRLAIFQDVRCQQVPLDILTEPIYPATIMLWRGYSIGF